MEGWLSHEGGKKEMHLDEMPSLLRTQGRKAGCTNSRQGNMIREDGQREKAAKSWSESCQDLREDEALHFRQKHECKRWDMMVLNLF